MSCGCENDNNREELMKKVMAYKFAVNDMSLFLDTHPTDEKALKLHNEYVREYDKAKCEYESKYGPLSFETEMDSWQWVTDMWPWETEVR